MHKRLQRWSLVSGLGMVLILAGWWYMKNGGDINKKWSQLLPGGKQREEVYKVIPTGKISPIQKKVQAETAGVTYILRVELARPWERQAQGKYQLLRGGVILQGDPLKRIIEVQIGMLDGTAYIGEYPEGWEGGETGYYKVRPQSDLEQLVGLGDEMRLEYKVTQVVPKENRELLGSTTKILDGLAEEYRSGEYKIEIPKDFLVTTEKVGVKPK